ncbi:hypothetical protein O163_11440 [Caldanaerobacter subterraneus subsp. yonseiensis KB-1]|uniref:Uncharacterized protein n=1 Tax=Caldanaerobacter subterraneus subsp. yonseiensis KB-1 TaxID=1388761 RepID=U5CMK1_CALSX|nr:hypothetical protein [Caldanaerobacter subterraneus]ERM91238.1 hypothetical protein O163_11440 [Caldanaerobacter subterraneus subsp. yonseiensis KB-1]
MKKIYLDTSVISFLEAHDAPDKEVNRINRKYGYPSVDITSPLNLIKEECEFNYERAKNNERTS